MLWFPAFSKVFFLCFFRLDLFGLFVVSARKGFSSFNLKLPLCSFCSCSQFLHLWSHALPSFPSIFSIQGRIWSLISLCSESNCELCYFYKHNYKKRTCTNTFKLIEFSVERLLCLDQSVLLLISCKYFMWMLAMSTGLDLTPSFVLVWGKCVTCISRQLSECGGAEGAW